MTGDDRAGLLAAVERVRALTADLWRVTPCGCGHRADLHTMGRSDSGCIGGFTLCRCMWTYDQIVAERIARALDGAEGGKP